MKQSTDGHAHENLDDDDQADFVAPTPERPILVKKKWNLRRALSPDLTLILPPKAGGG